MLSFNPLAALLVPPKRLAIGKDQAYASPIEIGLIATADPEVRQLSGFPPGMAIIVHGKHQDDSESALHGVFAVTGSQRLCLAGRHYGRQQTTASSTQQTWRAFLCSRVSSTTAKRLTLIVTLSEVIGYDG